VINPYAPPTSNEGAHEHDGRDRADLFIDSIPPPILKGAAILWFSLGVFVTLFFLHIVTDLRMTTVVGVLAVIHFALALACFGIGVGILRGRIGVAVLGLGVTPVIVMACAFALWTGAFAGFLALGLVLLAPALTAVSWKSIAKVGRAKALLASPQHRD